MVAALKQDACMLSGASPEVYNGERRGWQFIRQLLYGFYGFWIELVATEVCNFSDMGGFLFKGSTG